MTIDRETVIRLAREAGLGPLAIPNVFGRGPFTFDFEQLQSFAALVQKHGRKPLTEREIEGLLLRTEFPALSLSTTGERQLRQIAVALTRSIEAAHGITNKESSDAER